MLIAFSQFQTRQGVKNANDLLTPRTINHDSVTMPRGVVIHDLNWHTTDHFPTRQDRHLNGIPSKKRVPIQHIREIPTQDEVQMLANRYIEKEIKEWMRGKMESFRPWDVIAFGSNDNQANAVVNYNLLKDQYRYKTTLTAPLSKYRNVMRAYWQGVNTAASAQPQNLQWVTLPIPTAIPSRAIVNRIIEYPDFKYAKVVTNPDLNGILQLYRYLDPTQRHLSTMADLQESNADRIVLEFTYKGYSVFCRFSILLALHKDSALESKTKLPTLGLQKLLLLHLLKAQTSIEGKLQGMEPDATASDLSSTDDPQAADEVDLLEDMDEPSSVEGSVKDDEVQANYERSLGQKPNSVTPTLSRITAAKMVDSVFDEDDDFSNSIQLDRLIEAQSKELEGSTDELFIQSMTAVDKPPKLSSDASKEQEEEVPDPHAIDRSEENLKRLLKTPTVQEKFENHLQEAKQHNVISTAEVRALKKVFEKRQQLQSPYHPEPIDTFKLLTQEDLSLPDPTLPVDNPLVQDHLKKDVLMSLDRKYLKDPMKKHITACVTHLENFDIVIKDYQVEKLTSSTGQSELHKLTLKPLKGKESTIYFRLPVINDEGEFISGGVKYRMRRLMIDAPLRKISPVRVGITSNYSKVFIGRTERKAFDPYNFIAEQIKHDYLDNKGNISKIAPANRYRNTLKLPNTYAAMSRHFNDITTPQYTFFFHYDRITDHIEEKVHQDLQKQSLVFIGHDSQAHILAMDQQEQIFDYSAGMKPLGRLEQLLQLPTEKIPKAFSTMKVLGDDIPLGVVLSYYLGFKNLVAVTQSQMEVYPPRKQVTPPTRGVVLSFEDSKVVITCPTAGAELLFAGFMFYKAFLKTHPLETFYNQNIYLDMLEVRGCGLMHLKELDMLRDGLIDPITRDALEAQGEPTEYFPLLLRANQLLEDFHHLDINDPTLSRLRGYDRVPSLMYRALSESVREHRMKGGRGKVELDPYKVWKYVCQDTTVKITEDSNPITDTKEIESATFSGLDGMSRTATPERLRRYHANDKQLVTEATVDSSDVALNFLVSPYAKVKSVLGDVDLQVRDTDEHPDLVFSTAVHLTPFAESDDPKRIYLFVPLR